MNTNAFHNILNFATGAIGIVLATDLTVFGLAPTTAGKIAAGALIGQSVLKLAVNIWRDGATGLVKEQPPVKN